MSGMTLALYPFSGFPLRGGLKLAALRALRFIDSHRFN
jgi:hypothetical protein